MSDIAPLILADVTLTYPDGTQRRTILDCIDLSVDAGEVIAVVGASGSGKSSLLAVAGLLRPPDSGKITIAGTPMADASRKQQTRIRRDSIGLIFQSSNLFPSLTALEQLEFVAHMAGRLDSAAKAQAASLLDSVGLADRAGQRPSELSGGERQRVGIARSLMANPPVLLADEPTASLDEARGNEVMAMLVEQARRHSTATVIVTHVSAALELVDRVVELRDGRLLTL